jgi:protein-tyrosine phosphatase
VLAVPIKLFLNCCRHFQDFNAPEHAPAMLKFVKRINEAWSGSSPILVHCSAGVGRSGTLIAIDSLTQVIYGIFLSQLSVQAIDR